MGLSTGDWFLLGGAAGFLDYKEDKRAAALSEEVKRLEAELVAIRRELARARSTDSLSDRHKPEERQEANESIRQRLESDSQRMRCCRYLQAKTGRVISLQDLDLMDPATPLEELQTSCRALATTEEWEAFCRVPEDKFDDFCQSVADRKVIDSRDYLPPPPGMPANPPIRVQPRADAQPREEMLAELQTRCGIHKAGELVGLVMVNYPQSKARAVQSYRNATGARLEDAIAFVEKFAIWCNTWLGTL